MTDRVSAADRLQVTGVLAGSWVAQCAATVAELGVADLLAAGPHAPAWLAERSGADPHALRRILRALAVVDLVHEDAGGTFALAAAGHALRGDVAGSMAAAARATGGVVHGRLGRLTDEIRGERRGDAGPGRAWDAVLGRDEPPPDVAARIEPSPGDVLVEISLGAAPALALVLRGAPGATGVLLVTAEHAERAGRWIEGAGLDGRCEIAVGDPTDKVPAGAPVLLSRALREVDDDEAARILRAVRARAATGDRLLVLERVLPDDGAPHPGRLDDVALMLAGPGRERSEAQLRALLDEAGFTVAALDPPPVDPRAEHLIQAWAR